MEADEILNNPLAWRYLLGLKILTETNVQSLYNKAVLTERLTKGKKNTGND